MEEIHGPRYYADVETTLKKELFNVILLFLSCMHIIYSVFEHNLTIKLTTNLVSFHIEILGKYSKNYNRGSALPHQPPFHL